MVVSVAHVSMRLPDGSCARNRMCTYARTVCLHVGMCRRVAMKMYAHGPEATEASGNESGQRNLIRMTYSKNPWLNQRNQNLNCNGRRKFSSQGGGNGLWAPNGRAYACAIHCSHFLRLGTLARARCNTRFTTSCGAQVDKLQKRKP